MRYETMFVSRISLASLMRKPLMPQVVNGGLEAKAGN